MAGSDWTVAPDQTINNGRVEAHEQPCRQAYDAQQIVAELSESLRTTTEIPRLLGSVANKLQAALQTENVVIFLRDGQTGDYRTQNMR